jgi:hypothetical protein
MKSLFSFLVICVLLVGPGSSDIFALGGIAQAEADPTLMDCHPQNEVWVDPAYCHETPGWGCRSFNNVRDGITGVAEGGTVRVAAGTYLEAGQIAIDKNLSVIGEDRETTIIRPASDTGPGGDAAGWFLVKAGTEFNLKNITLDGEGRNIANAIRTHGSGSITGNTIRNLKYARGSSSGIHIHYAVPGQSWVISGNKFSNIDGKSILVDNASARVSVSGNTHSGKDAVVRREHFDRDDDHGRFSADAPSAPLQAAAPPDFFWSDAVVSDTTGISPGARKAGDYRSPEANRYKERELDSLAANTGNRNPARPIRSKPDTGNDPPPFSIQDASDYSTRWSIADQRIEGDTYYFDVRLAFTGEPADFKVGDVSLWIGYNENALEKDSVDVARYSGNEIETDWIRDIAPGETIYRRMRKEAEFFIQTHPQHPDTLTIDTDLLWTASYDYFGYTEDLRPLTSGDGDSLFCIVKLAIKDHNQPFSIEWKKTEASRITAGGEGQSITDFTVSGMDPPLEEDLSGDGMSNWWKINSGFDPADDGAIGESAPGKKDGPGGPLSDPDGDHWPNLAECRYYDMTGRWINPRIDDGGQAIPLHKGWNLISYTVNTAWHLGAAPPAGILPGVETVRITGWADFFNHPDRFRSGSAANMISAKVRLPDGTEQYYSQWQEPHHNTLEYITPDLGLWINMAEADTLMMWGWRAGARRIAPQSDYPDISLGEGWNLIGVLPRSRFYTEGKPKDVASPSDLVAEKGYAGIEAMLKAAFNLDTEQFNRVSEIHIQYPPPIGGVAYNKSVPEKYQSLHFIQPGTAAWIRLTGSGAMTINYREPAP